MRLQGRHSFAALHGRRHIDKQRLIALLMIGTGLARVLAWAALCGLYFAGAHFAVALFASVKFVCVLSVLALLLTDWSQVVASFAALVGGDTHHDAEATRRVVTADQHEVEHLVAALAHMKPGPDSDELVQSIRRRLAA